MSAPVRSHSGGIETRVSDLERVKRTGQLNRYTLLTVPPASESVGCMIYVTNGAAGLPIAAFSDGVNWLRCDTRAVIS